MKTNKSVFIHVACLIHKNIAKGNVFLHGTVVYPLPYHFQVVWHTASLLPQTARMKKLKNAGTSITKNGKGRHGLKMRKNLKLHAGWYEKAYNAKQFTCVTSPLPFDILRKYQITKIFFNHYVQNIYYSCNCHSYLIFLQG